MRTPLRPASKSPVLVDLALLVSRVALGVILLAPRRRRAHRRAAHPGGCAAQHGQLLGAGA